MTSGIAHRRARTVWGVLLGLATAFALSASVALAEPQSGTVKIHDGTGEPAAEIKNEPKVGCPFFLHFFFSDSSHTGTWWIQSWPPTGDMTTVATGSYAAGGDGEDIVGPLSLDEGHYKLFWEDDESNLVKHKAFWTEACEAGLGEEPTPFQGASGGLSGGTGGDTSLMLALLLSGGSAAAFVLLRPSARRIRND